MRWGPRAGLRPGAYKGEGEERARYMVPLQKGSDSVGVGWWGCGRGWFGEELVGGRGQIVHVAEEGHELPKLMFG